MALVSSVPKNIVRCLGSRCVRRRLRPQRFPAQAKPHWHYAVLNDHLHLVVEATGCTTLSRGVQGLLVRIARALNRLWQHRGRVFADRYHDHILRSPRDVRNVLRYVLGSVLANGKKHAAEGRAVAVTYAIDTFTSAPWFEGFRETIVVRGLEAVVRPVGWLTVHLPGRRVVGQNRGLARNPRSRSMSDPVPLVPNGSGHGRLLFARPLSLRTRSGNRLAYCGVWCGHHEWA
ncbi:MAG: hypothetical protein ABIP94_14255 [Planctomycetota bacterium]